MHHLRRHIRRRICDKRRKTAYSKELGGGQRRSRALLRRCKHERKVVHDRKFRRTAAHIAPDLRLERIRFIAYGCETQRTLRSRRVLLAFFEDALHLVCIAALRFFLQALCLCLLRIDRLLRTSRSCCLLRLDACGDARANLRLPLAIECHLTCSAFALEFLAIPFPYGALGGKLLL